MRATGYFGRPQTIDPPCFAEQKEMKIAISELSLQPTEGADVEFCPRRERLFTTLHYTDIFRVNHFHAYHSLHLS